VNRKAERLLAAAEGLPEGAVLVEIGCVRYSAEFPSEGWSTVYLARAASDHGWTFHSVDNDLQAVQNAQSLCHGEEVTIHCDDGAAWLAMFDGMIDLLYLDGSASPSEAVMQYLAAPLSPTATVVIDDVQRIGMQEQGKGDALLDLLTKDGFKVEISDTEHGYLMAVATR